MQAEDTEINVGQYWRGLKRRWLPVLLVFCGTTVAVGLLGRAQDPQYLATGKLRFKQKDAVSTLTGLRGDERGRLEALNFRESPVSTELQILRSVPIIEETIETLNLRSDGELVSPSVFLSRLETTEDAGSDILTVTYRAPDPQLANAAVDTLMAVYMQQHLLDNRAEAVAAREFIEAQLPDAEIRASQAEAALRSFKERNQIVALEPETVATVGSLRDNTDKITEAISQLNDAEAQLDSYQLRIGGDPQAALVATAVSQSEGVQGLLREYQSVESELATERVRFQEQHPVVVDLKTELANLGSLLDQRVSEVAGAEGLPSGSRLQVSDVETALVGEYIRLEARADGLREQVQTLQSAQDVTESRAAILPQLEQEQNELVRRLDAAQSTYSLLLQRLQEVRVAENQNVGNVRIIQPANTLDWPVSPNQKLYIAAGALLGACFAVSTAFLLEALDKSVKTVDQIKRRFQYPVLGIVPSFDEMATTDDQRMLRERRIPELVVADNNTSVSAEAFHMLRSNLRFLNSDHPPKAIVVTSSAPGEGKSTVASNLAASIAQTGKSVLLIDADLHHPTQHWAWDVNNGPGLSNLLVDEISLKKALNELAPNLFLLLAGSVSPNPASLLDSQKMANLLQAFRARFDYIIIDSPPLNGGASASILGKMSDGLMVVVRPKVATAGDIDYAQELIDRFQQSVLGIVVNGTLSRYESHRYFFAEEFYDDSVEPVASEPNSHQEKEVTMPRR